MKVRIYLLGLVSYICLIVVLICGCSIQNTYIVGDLNDTDLSQRKSDILYDNVNISYGNGAIVCTCDFNSDGDEDTVECNYEEILEQGNAGIGLIEVRDDDKVIWTDTFSLPYTGYKKIYITMIDNSPCLIEYLPAHARQGEWIGSIIVFGFDEQNELEIYKQFYVSGTEEQAKEFDEISKDYIEEATLLVSTYGGRLIYYKFYDQ